MFSDVHQMNDMFRVYPNIRDECFVHISSNTGSSINNN